MADFVKDDHFGGGDDKKKAVGFHLDLNLKIDTKRNSDDLGKKAIVLRPGTPPGTEWNPSSEAKNGESRIKQEKTASEKEREDMEAAIRQVEAFEKGEIVHGP